MRSFVAVVLTCAGLLAGCGSIGPGSVPSGPSEDKASFRDRAVAVARAQKGGGRSTAGTALPPPK